MEIMYIEVFNLLEFLSDWYNGSVDRGLIFLEFVGIF